MLKRSYQQALTRWPIEGLVWPFVAVVLLAGWIAVIAQVRSERDDARSTAIARSQERAFLLEQHVIRTLQVAGLTSHHLGDIYFGNLAGDGELPDRIDDPSIGISAMTGAAVFSPEGTMLAAIGPSVRNDGFDLIGEHARREGESGIVVHALRSDRNTDSGQIPITRRIERQGSTAGYVALFLGPEQLLNFSRRRPFLPTDVVSVINLEALTLARREGDIFSSGQDVSNGLVMGEQRRSPNGTYLGPSALDGHVRYFSHRRLTDYPIFVTAGVSHSMALTEAERRATRYFIVMGAMTIVGLGMAWLIQREARFRRARSEELVRSTERLENAQKIGKIGDWEYDFKTASILWSAELCAMYERPAEDNLLKLEDLTGYFGSREIARFRKELKALLSGEESVAYETKVILPSGKLSQRSIHAAISRDETGRLERLYGTDQDITEAYLLNELEKHVAHLDRQGAMNMMASTMAHELNQPLTAASNYLSGAIRIATAKDHANELIVTGIRSALDQVHDAAEIIRRARMMVEADTSTERSSVVSVAIDEAVALLAASGFPQAKAIALSIEPGLANAAITSIQLQQVLVNILKNAMEAAASDNPSVELRASISNDGLLIEVQDNGPGFASGPKEAFSVFRTSKAGGLGLGLPISRTIIEYHGGQIAFRESGTGGTIVAITLPWALETQSTAA